MRHILARAAFAAFVSAAAASHPAAAQDCQLKEIASLDMKFDAAGRVLIPISLDDTPRMMLVDTGAPIGLLSAGAADELGIGRQSIPPHMASHFYSASGTKPTQFALVPSLKIGPDEAKYTSFLIVKWQDDALAPFAGTIGYDILHNFDLDFDFAKQQLNLFSPDHCDGKVVYWAAAYTDAAISVSSDSKHIAVTMSLDGHDVDAIIDTGAGQTVLSLSAAKEMFGLDTNSPGVETVTEGAGDGQRKYYLYRFKTLSLSGIAVKNPLIVLLPDAADEQEQRDLSDSKLQGYEGIEIRRGPRLILGTDVLRHLHFYIAYKEQKIYATAADAGMEPTPAPPAGH